MYSNSNCQCHFKPIDMDDFHVQNALAAIKGDNLDKLRKSSYALISELRVVGCFDTPFDAVRASELIFPETPCTILDTNDIEHDVWRDHCKYSAAHTMKKSACA